MTSILIILKNNSIFDSFVRKELKSMKKKVLLTSLMSIAMLASIASGATYALFTAEDTTNIAVNAGKVNVSANVEETTLKTYSMGVEQTYGTFENSGTAEVDAQI